MARISKAEHGRILHLVDVEGRKVAEVAAEYGCTPANIYALLAKLRRTAAPAADAPTPGAPMPETVEAPEADAPAAAPVVADLFAAVPPVVPATAALSDLALAPEPAIMPEPSTDLEAVVAPEPAVAPAPPPVPVPPRSTPATVTELPRRTPAKAPAAPGAERAVGAKLAKPGYGLVMRTAEGEENTTPFRSLDDLLSAVKPILRTAARSPDPVWFSIQSLDLSALDSDAA